MKKILYYPALEKHKCYHYFPLSLLAVASAMKDDVVIIDERVDPPEKLEQHILTADAILFTAYTGYQLACMYAKAKWVKENYPNIKVVLGGPHVTLLKSQCLESPYIDEVSCGYAEKGENELPWHLIDVAKYINPETERFIYVSSYSCIGKCSFCATIPRRKLVFLPLEKVQRDIDNLMELYPFKQAVLFDATLFTKPDRALFVSQLMKKHSLSWICDSRADEVCRMDKGVLDKIVNSGLQQITIGLETGNERMANFIKKGKNHVEKFKECARILSEYNVIMASGLIFGMPTETIDELKETVQYVEEIRAINKNFRLSTTFWKPLPATELTEFIKRNYGYREPSSLKEWAELGAGNHFEYNTWMDNPWIENQGEYRAIYDKFKLDNQDIFI